MRILLYVLICFSLVTSGGYAQVDVPSGSVFIKAEPRVDSLVNLHIEYNNMHKSFPGYRIQILMVSGNDAINVAGEVMTEFEEEYPDIPVYLTFGEPNYRVRVGDFRTRLEAEKFLAKVTRNYPGAWVTQDNISFPVLPKYNKNDSYE